VRIERLVKQVVQRSYAVCQRANCTAQLFIALIDKITCRGTWPQLVPMLRFKPSFDPSLPT